MVIWVCSDVRWWLGELERLRVVSVRAERGARGGAALGLQIGLICFFIFLLTPTKTLNFDFTKTTLAAFAPLMPFSSMRDLSSLVVKDNVEARRQVGGSHYSSWSQVAAHSFLSLVARVCKILNIAIHSLSFLSLNVKPNKSFLKLKDFVYIIGNFTKPSLCFYRFWVPR